VKFCYLFICHLYFPCRYVMQIYVDGHRDQPSLVAVVVPDPEQMVAFAKSAGIPSTDPKELAKNPKVREEIFQDMLRVSKEDSLAFFEQVAVGTRMIGKFIKRV